MFLVEHGGFHGDPQRPPTKHRISGALLLEETSVQNLFGLFRSLREARRAM